MIGLDLTQLSALTKKKVRLTCLSYLHHATQLRGPAQRESPEREKKKGTDCIARLPTFALPYPLSVIKFSSFIYTEQLRYLSCCCSFMQGNFLIYKTRNNNEKEKKIREVMAKKVSYGNDM